MATTTTTAHRPSLDEIRIADAMHPGVLKCSVETPLAVVARMLAMYNVHCVVVFGSEEEHEDGELEPWAVVTDLDLLEATLAGGLEELTAGGSAGDPPVFVSGRETLELAARLMLEHGTTHLIVIEPDTKRPVGILSTLDVAAALAGMPVRSGPPHVERR